MTLALSAGWLCVHPFESASASSNAFSALTRQESPERPFLARSRSDSRLTDRALGFAAPAPPRAGVAVIQEMMPCAADGLVRRHGGAVHPLPDRGQAEGRGCTGSDELADAHRLGLWLLRPSIGRFGGTCSRCSRPLSPRVRSCSHRAVSESVFTSGDRLRRAEDALFPAKPSEWLARILAV